MYSAIRLLEHEQYITTKIHAIINRNKFVSKFELLMDFTNGFILLVKFIGNTYFIH